ncbi:MAG: ArsR family transcriptional regulator [Candidatus Bathyarchaeota archaeon]|nr:MAG: winged helix-turn-helix domain-containing protein [Candidatus Bathyarchaeum tardum]WNZ29189.1 MAG: ArsR family transcriptional regulator [Candidatus Bathyarchaeota archaeon]
MRRSRMETHLEILKILAQKRSLKLTELMYETNTNCSVLKEHLKFLVRKELIVENSLKNKNIVYDVTEQGLMVLKHFNELETILSKTKTKPVKIQTIL